MLLISIVFYIGFGLIVLNDTNPDFIRIANGDKIILYTSRFLAVFCWLPIAVIGSIVVLIYKLWSEK